MHHKTVWVLDHIHPIEIIWCGQGFQNPVCKTIFLEKPTAKSDDHFLWKLDGASTRRLIAGRCAFFWGGLPGLDEVVHTNQTTMHEAKVEWLPVSTLAGA